MPYVILIIAVFVCVISNAVLAHVAIISRNRMAEVILTKRRIWRIMAEKEAAEQANELKQQFISVASHEVRLGLVCFQSCARKPPAIHVIGTNHANWRNRSERHYTPLTATANYWP